MSNRNGCKFCVSKILLVFASILLGVASAYLWFLDYIILVRTTLPYALAFGLVVIGITTFLKARCCNSYCHCDEEERAVCSTCHCVTKYSTLILIASILMVLIGLMILATNLSIIIRFIFALFGSISFWATILTFSTMVYCICFKRSC